jgi:hypothetical protein
MTGIGERILNPITPAAISSLPVVVEVRVLTRRPNFAAEDIRRYASYNLKQNAFEIR